MSSDSTAHPGAVDHQVLLPRRLRPDLWRAFNAERGKVFSVRAPMLCLAAALLTALVIATALANDFVLNVRNGQQPPFAVADAVDILGQAVHLAAVVAGAGLMLVVTDEYAKGTASTTFAAQPRRATVLLAKAAVAALLAAMAGAVIAALGMVATLIVLGGHAAPGGPGVAEFAARAGVLWAVLALFVVALATVVRSAVGTLAALVVILLALLAVPDPVGSLLPGQASLTFLTVSDSSYPSLPGLAVVVVWAGLMPVAATGVQGRRDL